MLHNDLFSDQKSTDSRVRVACDPVAELAALVEGMAARKCSAGQIVAAVRSFASEASAARQPSAEAAQPAPVWIPLDSPEWRAWATHWRETRGTSPPLDRRGGWRFPSRLPPQPSSKGSTL